MKRTAFSLAILAVVASPAMAAPGDQWILGIHHINNQNETPFTSYVGAGYSGPQSSGDPQYVGNSYGYASTGAVGVNRVYWELSGNSVNNGTPVPTTTELYKVEFFGTTEAGHNDWQPVESQFHGIVGEGFPYEPDIPWVGQFGTNHQWIAAGGANDGQWHVLGPGPQADSNPPADGTMMWLTAGSWLYAKWDFGFTIDRTWSALRLTQVAPISLPPVTGDYNGNHVVDAADYVVWRKTFGQTGVNLPADGFEDGMIDEFDYIIWRDNFGHTSGSGSSTGSIGSLGAVPEPATLLLLALAGVAGLSTRRSFYG
jgi:PEP-CTERM motif